MKRDKSTKNFAARLFWAAASAVVGGVVGYLLVAIAAISYSR